jgi:hypothetical protein
MTLDLYPYPYSFLKKYRNKTIVEQWILREQLQNQKLSVSFITPPPPLVLELRKPLQRPSDRPIFVEPLDLPPSIFREIGKCRNCPLCNECLENALEAHHKEFQRRLDIINGIGYYYSTVAADCIAQFIADVIAEGAGYARILESLLENVYKVMRSIGDDFRGLEPYASPAFETLWQILTQNHQEGCIYGCPGTLPLPPLPNFPISEQDKELLLRCGAACYTRSGKGLFPEGFDWRDVGQVRLMLRKFLWNETVGGQQVWVVWPGLTIIIRILTMLGGELGFGDAAQTCIDAAKDSWLKEKGRLERELLTGPPYPAFRDWDLYNRQRTCVNFVLPLCDTQGSVGNDAER